MQSTSFARGLANCLQDELKRLLDDNHPHFEKYQRELRKLEKQWLPLEKERARRLLYGDVFALARRCLEASLAGAQDAANLGEATVEGYHAYLEEYLSKRAIELAHLPTYEKTRWTMDAPLDHESVRIFTVITQKTSDFLMEMKSVLSNGVVLEGHRMNQLIPDMAIYYLRSFEAAFSMQLEQLPHLAALFYNDSRALSAFCSIQCGAEQNKLLAMENGGALVLQRTLTKLQAELGDICSAELWKCRFGTLESSSLEPLQKSVAQASLRLSLTTKVWQPILDSGLFLGLMSEMIAMIPQWVVGGLLSLKSISQDARKLLVEFLHLIVRMPEEILGASLAARTPIPQLGKLECIARIIQQNLIQVSNAFRRDEYHGRLDLLELRALVAILFPETAMKAAFLAEIDAEIN